MSIGDLLAGLVAACLLVVILYLIYAVVRAARGRAVVIAPFLISGHEDSEGLLGRAMALMLRGRIQQLRQDFEASRPEPEVARTPAPATEFDKSVLMSSIPAQLSTAPVIMPLTVLSDSPSIDVKVAGIEFGGLATWIERAATRRRTLTVAVYFGDSGALISANLSALPGVNAPDVWLQTARDPGEIVTALAYTILQGEMAASWARAIGALRLEEFSDLITSLSMVDDLNRRVAAGRTHSVDDYGAVLDSLRQLPDKVPEWAGLTHLVAQIADRAGDSELALRLYRRLLVEPVGGRPQLEPLLLEKAARRVEDLDASMRPVTDARAHAFLEEVEEYQRQLGLEPPHPRIILMHGPPPEGSATMAIWREESQRYEVNPDIAADPRREMTKQAALMGRFLARHYSRCSSSMDPQFWNSFRISVVDFLIMTEPGSTYQSQFNHPLLGTFQEIGRTAGVDAARRLALRALDLFECSWDAATLPDELATIGAEVGVPEDVVRRAFVHLPA